MKGVNGEMRFARNPLRAVASGSCFGERLHARNPLGDAMAMRAARIFAWRRMKGFRVNKSGRKLNVAWIPPRLRWGWPAHRMVVVSNPDDLYGRGGDDEYLTFAQETSLSEQFAQQW